MRKAAFLAALLLAGLVVGQTPKRAVRLEVTGDTVLVVKSFPVTVTASPGADIYVWDVPPDLTAKAVENVLTITGAKANGTYTVSVSSLTVAIDFEKKTLIKTKDSGSTVINIGGTKPPEPPLPPVPLSDLAKAFKAAAGGDLASLAALGDFYAEAGLYLDVGALDTGRKVRDKMREGALLVLPAEKIPKVRELIADEWAKTMPGPDVVLTVDAKTIGKALFKRIAAALTEASK